MRLLDKTARDQFIVRYLSRTEIYWNDAKRGGPDIVYARDNWTETFVQWSPQASLLRSPSSQSLFLGELWGDRISSAPFQGNYLATMHRPGVALWGGPDFDEVKEKVFQRAIRFEHENVKLIDFSPNEDYVVTWSPATKQTGNKVCLRIFAARNGKLLREFEGSPEEFAVGQATGAAGGQAMLWPLFKWAGGAQDRYFAKLSPNGNAINVYEAPGMGLLDKKSVRLDNVQDFSWSPSGPILAAYQAENGNLPARIVLIRMPERTEVRQKNLFSVADVKMLWQPEGDYLAVRVDQYTKTKKSIYTTFQIFRQAIQLERGTSGAFSFPPSSPPPSVPRRQRVSPPLCQGLRPLHRSKQPPC